MSKTSLTGMREKIGPDIPAQAGQKRMFYIIYHKVNEWIDCPDGIMSAAVVYLHLKLKGIPERNQLEVLGDWYRDAKEYPETPEIIYSFGFQKVDEIIMVDFSVPGRWLKHWIGQGIKVTVIDHHEAKFGMLSEFSGAILDKNECGASLAWRHFFPHVQLPELLVHVLRRDIGKDGYYKGQQRRSEAINEALGLVRKEFSGSKLELVQYLAQLLDANSLEFVEQLAIDGEPALIERDRIIENTISRVGCCYLLGHTVAYIKLGEEESRFYSMIGNRISQHFNAPIVWLETEDGQQHLRSSTGFNTQPLAKFLGGDGHPPASGFRYAPQIHNFEINIDSPEQLIGEEKVLPLSLAKYRHETFKKGDVVEFTTKVKSFVFWIKDVSLAEENHILSLLLSDAPY